MYKPKLKYSSEHLRYVRRLNRLIVKTLGIKKLSLWLFCTVLDEQRWFLVTLYFSFVLNYIIGNRDVVANNPIMLYYMALGYFIFTITMNVSWYFQSSYRAIFERDLDISLKKMSVEKITSLDYVDCENPHLKNKINNIERNLGTIRMTFFNQVSMFADIASVVIAVGALTYFKWWYAPAIFISVLPSFFLNRTRTVRRYHQENRLDEINRWSSELKRNLTTADTKIFQRGAFFSSLFLSIDSKSTKLYSKFREKWTIHNFWVSCWTAFIMVFVISSLFLSIGSGEIIAGSFLVIFSAINNIRTSINSFLDTSVNLDVDLMKVRDFFTVMDTKPSLPEPIATEAFYPENGMNVEFRNVSFKYPGDKDWILYKLNLKVQAGEHIGIVGRNGSGKTTLVSLLLRLYDPTEGDILINGVSLRNIRKDDYYQHTAALLQDFTLFYGKVSTIIALGDINRASQSGEIVRAAERAGIHERIMDFGHKYNQQIGRIFKSGIKPSGGESQKLAMAQVIYRDPKLVVLDEPTAALDAISESEIYKNYSEIAKGKTTFLISHRNKSLEHVSRIIVMEKGKIIEDGSHEVLMEQKGSYYKLHTSQLTERDNKIIPLSA